MTEQPLLRVWAKITELWKPLGFFVASVITVFLVYWGWEGFVSEDIDQRGTAFRNFGLPILAIWGICLAVWRSLIAQKQADTAAQHAGTAAQHADTAAQHANTAAQHANTAAQQADTAARSLQNDRYQKGAEMLGSKGLPVRVGGINLLRLRFCSAILVIWSPHINNQNPATPL